MPQPKEADFIRPVSIMQQEFARENDSIIYTLTWVGVAVFRGVLENA